MSMSAQQIIHVAEIFLLNSLTCASRWQLSHALGLEFGSQAYKGIMRLLPHSHASFALSLFQLILCPGPQSARPFALHAPFRENPYALGKAVPRIVALNLARLLVN